MNAPVVLFCYNRPQHLRRTLGALAANVGFDETRIFVCSDGPRTLADRSAVEAVRDVVRTAGHANVTLVESLHNKGLYEAITQGVTRFVTEFGRVIVVEDDLLTSPFFLLFMNASLEKYEEVEEVLQVCGFGVRSEGLEMPATFFSPMSLSWGWATWDRAWSGFNAFDLEGAFRRLRTSSELRHGFDLNGHFPAYFTLRRNVRGKTESWAVVWQLYLFLQGGLTIWPSRSLVRSIGSEGSGSHSRWSRKDLSRRTADPPDEPIVGFPIRVGLDPTVWDVVLEAVVDANPCWHRWLSAWTRRFP